MCSRERQARECTKKKGGEGEWCCGTSPELQGMGQSLYSKNYIKIRRKPQYRIVCSIDCTES